MKNIGIILIIAGVILGLAAINYDTSVSTQAGDRVHNLGLMQQQQTHLIIAAAGAIAGVILLVMGRRERETVERQHQPQMASKSDEIAKLLLLQQAGALTSEEFSREKQKILGYVVSDNADLVRIDLPKGGSDDMGAEACTAALTQLGYGVKNIRENAWGISSPTGKSTSYAYSLADLRKITAREVAAQLTQT